MRYKFVHKVNTPYDYGAWMWPKPRKSRPSIEYSKNT